MNNVEGHNNNILTFYMLEEEMNFRNTFSFAYLVYFFTLLNTSIKL